GERLLVLGPRGSGRTSLLRAAAGLWITGQGRVIRPPLDQGLFLPQQPYLRHCSLRAQPLYRTPMGDIFQGGARGAPAAVGLDCLLERLGTLEAECDWSSTLSFGEQQCLACARLLLANPRFAFLDEAACALDEDKIHQLYEALARSAITYVSAASWSGL